MASALLLFVFHLSVSVLGGLLLFVCMHYFQVTFVLFCCKWYPQYLRSAVQTCALSTK